MNARVITIAVLLAIGLMVAPATVPALEDLSITEEAEAAACVVGYNQDCIVTIVCVTHPCGPPW